MVEFPKCCLCLNGFVDPIQLVHIIPAWDQWLKAVKHHHDEFVLRRIRWNFDKETPLVWISLVATSYYSPYCLLYKHIYTNIPLSLSLFYSSRVFCFIPLLGWHAKTQFISHNNSNCSFSIPETNITPEKRPGPKGDFTRTMLFQGKTCC